MSYLSFALSLLASVCVASVVAAQGLVQVNCAISLESGGDELAARAVVAVSQPTRVDYTFRTLRIGGAGTASTEQSGSQRLDAGETAVLSSVVVNTGDGGLFQFELDIRERLTGVECSAEEVFDPL